MTELELTDGAGVDGVGFDGAGFDGAGVDGKRVDDAHNRHQEDRLRAGVATAQVRQRLEEGRQQDLQRRDAAVPGILLRGQGVEAAAVLRLEHHRTDGRSDRRSSAELLYIAYVQ